MKRYDDNELTATCDDEPLEFFFGFILAANISLIFWLSIAVALMWR